MNIQKILLLVAILTISGCASVNYDKPYLEGNYQEIISLYEVEKKAKRPVEHSGTEWIICRSYLEVRRYDDFDDCYQRLQKRVVVEGIIEPVLRPGSVKIYHLCCSTTTDQAQALVLPLQARRNLELGNYDKAIEFADKAIEFSRVSMGSLSDHYTYKPAHSAAIAYIKKGQSEKALAYLNYMKPPEFDFINNRSEHERRNALAAVYFALGYYQKTLDVLDSISEAEKSRNAGTIGKAIMTFGLTFLIDSAISLAIDGTADPFEKQDFVYNQLPKAYMRAKCQLEIGNIEEARKTFDTIINNPVTASFGKIYWAALYDSAAIALHDNKPLVAINLLTRAVDIVEQQRQTVHTEATKIGFIEDKQALYHRLIVTLIQQKQFASAFEYVERAKSRALVDMLANKQQFVEKNEQQRDVVHAINLMQAEDLQMAAQSPFALNLDKDAVRGLKRKFERVKQQSPELASLISVSSLNTSQIQKLLAKDETLVEYYGNKKQLFAFIITRNSLNVVSLKSKQLVEHIQEFRKSILNTKSNAYLYSGKKLYQQLIAPLEKEITTIKVKIVAHGALHYLPFSALHDGKQFLIEQYQLSSLPSASVLAFLDNNKLDKSSLFVMGNPDLSDASMALPGAEQEAYAISKNKLNVITLVGHQATETALKTRGLNADILHIASHGEFNSEQPLKSRLLLVGDSQNDGDLTVRELYDLNLQADLVTLSACETGLGDIRQGDDVIGLTRGFLYAGANTIVSSLWKVDDAATAQLMVDFYDNIKTYGKNSALRKAQLVVKENYNSHPFYWAAFQLTGAP